MDCEDSPGNTAILPIKTFQEIFIGTASREESEKLLERSKAGSFHVRWSSTQSRYVISRRLEETSDHITVNQTTVGDVQYFSIKAGQGRRSLLLLIESHREDHQLLSPVVR